MLAFVLDRPTDDVKRGFNTKVAFDADRAGKFRGALVRPTSTDLLSSVVLGSTHAPFRAKQNP